MAIEFEDAKSVIISLHNQRNIKLNNCLILGNAIIYPTFTQLLKFAKSINFDLLDMGIENLNAIQFGKCLGFENVDTLDITEDASIQQDLTKELNGLLINKYDFIIDAGVLFYCFEPGVALRNIYLMAKRNSIIIHITAITGFFGRAYYNIHPLVLFDFYRINSGILLNTNVRPRPFKNKFINYIVAIYKKLPFFYNTDSLNIITFSNYNSIYYKASRITKIIFTNKHLKSENRKISNNIVGTYSFLINKKFDNITDPILSF